MKAEFLRNLMKRKREEQKKIKEQSKYFDSIIKNINEKIEEERKELEKDEELKEFLK